MCDILHAEQPVVLTTFDTVLLLAKARSEKSKASQMLKGGFSEAQLAYGNSIEKQP
jgi:hypothetical protein